MAPSSSIAPSTSINVFETGKYTTELIKVEQGSCCRKVSSQYLTPPKPLLIGTPSEAGVFPVLLFLHGYLLHNSFYSQLVQHIASHGFIVVAPQLYSVAGPDATEEIKSTASITNWFSEGLENCLPSHVQPNLTKLALSGHSRGGKVAFAVALGKAITSLKFSALIGVDPVDGMDKGKQIPPPILTYVPRSFDIDMAVLVLGSGLGEVKRNPLFPPCAPKGVNHEDFYNECQKPAYYFVAKDYGHVDMLNDDTTGIRGKATYCLCKNGVCREPMRRFIGGIMVAFLRAYLEDNSRDLEAIKDGHLLAPVEFQKFLQTFYRRFKDSEDWNSVISISLAMTMYVLTHQIHLMILILFTVLNVGFVPLVCVLVMSLGLEVQNNFTTFLWVFWISYVLCKLEEYVNALSNLQVLDFLRSSGAGKDPTQLIAAIAQSEYKVYDYLEQTAASTQATDTVKRVFRKMQIL